MGTKQTQVRQSMPTAMLGMVCEWLKKMRTYINSVPQGEVGTVSAADLETTLKFRDYLGVSHTYTANIGGGAMPVEDIALALVALINVDTATSGVTSFVTSGGGFVLMCTDPTYKMDIDTGALVNLSVKKLFPQTRSLNFGLFVVTHPSMPDKCFPPCKASDISVANNKMMLGVTVRHEDMEGPIDNYKGMPVDEDQFSGYFLNRPASILSQGTIWVKPEQPVELNSDVYVRFEQNSDAESLGAFRIDDDGGKAALLPVARFLTRTTAAGELALLEINMW